MIPSGYLLFHYKSEIAEKFELEIDFTTEKNTGNLSDTPPEQQAANGNPKRAYWSMIGLMRSLWLI